MEMKSTLVLATSIFLTASTVMAQITENQRWIEAADGGFIFPLSPAVSTYYDRGVGGDILVGYRFDRNLSLSIDVGYYDCDEKALGGASGEWIYSPILLLARYNFGDGWVRPYLLLGGGVAVNSYSLTAPFLGDLSQRETDPLLSPGLGVLFVVAKDTALYLQTRLDLNFSTAGGPWTDNPSLFLPLKAGLSFFAL